MATAMRLLQSRDANSNCCKNKILTELTNSGRSCRQAAQVQVISDIFQQLLAR